MTAYSLQPLQRDGIGEYAPDGAIPPEAIVGAWKVDGSGELEGQFVPNPNYQS